ncbi:hypothetical protein JTB14_020777 [Gonioctena quinquepunctata]|nr:hypothetical protein JTB14_020777 [Gonioctena quinquepunctata]
MSDSENEMLIMALMDRPDDVCSYTILTQASTSVNRSRGHVDRRISFIILVLICPVLLFFITYAVMFGIYPSLIYPKSTINVSEQSLHRAILYSSLGNMRNETDFLNISTNTDINSYKLVCYYTLPSDVHSLQVEELDPYLCTHINAAFARIVNNSLYLDDSQKESLERLVKLKSINTNLKVLISAGSTGDAKNYSEMVLNHKNRKSFIKSVLDYVKHFGIDGIDLDWEFPNELPSEDKFQRVHFTQLLEEIRKSINRQPNYPYIVTVAVAAPSIIVDNSYDVSYMNDYVDFVNLMSYDWHFYTRGTPFTGINSPLYAAENEKFYLSKLNTNYSANYWNHLGMERSKIIVGLPTYGHTFKLVNPKNNSTYAPAIGYGELGQLGFVDYPQVCQFLSSNQISPVFDMETKSPYASKDNEWISFENKQSLIYKAEYIRDNKFGGAMVWCLNSDDFRFLCENEAGNKEKFPLISSIKSVF